MSGRIFFLPTRSNTRERCTDVRWGRVPDRIKVRPEFLTNRCIREPQSEKVSDLLRDDQHGDPVCETHHDGTG